MTSHLILTDDHFHDECGVFGVFGHPEAANLAYLGLYALQHRGQESAGIVSSDGNELHLHRAMGQVEEIFQPNVLAQLPGSLSIGHTRYSTAGDKALLNAQPIMIDCNKGKVAIGDALNQVEGAYSLLVLTEDELYAVRDPRGFRPLVLGKLTTPGGFDSWLVASETCAFDLLNAQYIREIEPGEMVRISNMGIESIHFAPEKPLQQCIFEHVYFSRPDSIIFGRSVNESREMLGRLLAREHPVDADIVVPVPDSGVPAAVGYALESKIPFRMGLISNHYIGRTFIEPSQAIRNFGVKLKLNPIRGLIDGQRVILVDDSIVRGTTSRKIVRMVREVGAKEVHVRISCPPTNSPCYYGVTTHTREELIASSNTPEEICKFLGADSLGYVSLPALRRAVDDTKNSYCTSCYTGVYPTDLVQLEVRNDIASGKKGEAMINDGEGSNEHPVAVEHEG